MLGEAGFLERYGAIIEPAYFSDIYHQMLCEIINGYFKKYAVCPSIEVLIEEVEKIKEQERRQMLAATLEEVLGSFDAGLTDAGYYIDQTVAFCQRQALLLALRSGAKELRDGNPDGVLPTIEKAMLVGQAMDAENLGVNYWQDFDKPEIFEDEPKIPTMLGQPGGEGLDKILRGGLMQGNVGMVVLPVGRGKTVMLMNLAGNAVLQGYNVTYISLELSERALTKRCNSFFSGMPTELLETMDSAQIYDKVFNRYRNWKLGNFNIKTFPMMGVTVQQIGSYLKTLQNKTGYKTDLLLVDYMDIIKPPFRHEKEHQQLVDVSRELKAFAQRDKLPIWTAGQINRDGFKKKRAGMADSAGSFDKNFALDFVMLSVPQYDEENDVRTADFIIDKNRQGADQMVVSFDIDLKSMRFLYKEHEKHQSRSDQLYKTFQQGRHKK